jgi:hypothetical protein
MVWNLELEKGHLGSSLRERAMILLVESGWEGETAIFEVELEGRSDTT